MKKITTKQIIYIACFVAFGIGLGFFAAWHNSRYDTPLYLNLPASYLSIVIESVGIRGLSLTQLNVLASVIFWGVVGTLLTLFLKPKIIAWIMGAYLVIFGGLTIWYYLD